MRFLHFALFDGKFLSLHYYLVDYAVCLGFGLLGFRLMRVTQMVTRYSWINERAGLCAGAAATDAASLADDAAKSG